MLAVVPFASLSPALVNSFLKSLTWSGRARALLSIAFLLYFFFVVMWQNLLLVAAMRGIFVFRGWYEHSRFARQGENIFVVQPAFDPRRSYRKFSILAGFQALENESLFDEAGRALVDGVADVIKLFPKHGGLLSAGIYSRWLCQRR